MLKYSFDLYERRFELKYVTDLRIRYAPEVIIANTGDNTLRQCYVFVFYPSPIL
jgi:hypothetical protein